MSHSQTGTSLWKGSISSGGITSGPAIHERKREQERRRRAELAARNSEAVPAPLFDHPKKVVPPNDDPLQKSIKDVLGDLSMVMPALHHNRHQLYGIPRVPATPVDTRDGGFVFGASLQERKDLNDVRVTDKRAVQAEGSSKLPYKPSEKDKLQKGQTGDWYSEKGKAAKNGVKSVDNKSPKPREALELHKKSTKLEVSQKKPVKSKSSSEGSHSSTRKEKGKEKSGKVKDVGNKDQKGMASDDLRPEKSHGKKQKQEKGGKHDRSNKNGACNGEEDTLDFGEKKKRESSLCADVASKPKPSKLVMPKGPSQSGSDELMVESCPGEVNSVERILAEMTQPMGPPLTGIKTPIKGNHSSFPFPLNGFKEVPPVSSLAKPRKSSECKSAEANLSAELQVTDDDSDDDQVQQKGTSSKPKPNRSERQRSASVSSSSSDSSSGSDSDSSDSDSDSSDTSCPPSPKESECERSWGLGHIAQASQAKRTPPSSFVPATQAGTSPPALTIGGDGLRGDEAAPAPNMVDPSSEALSVDSLFGSCDDLTSSSFCTVREEFDSASLPFGLDLSSEDPAGSLALEPQHCSQGQNGTLLKEEKTDLVKRESTPEVKSNHDRKQAGKVSKPSKVKHEVGGTKNKKSAEKEGTAMNGLISKSKSKVKSENDLETTGKKENKRKSEAKSESKLRNGIDRAPARPAKYEEDEDTFVDVESDVGNPLLDGTGLTTKTKTTTKNKPTLAKAQKSASKMCNGVDVKHNGEKVDPAAVSPTRRKNGVKDGSALNGYPKPESLLVKIDLSLLKRVPKVPKNNQATSKEAVVSPPLENGSITSRPSTIKIPKRPHSVEKSGEQPEAKKARSESKKNSELSNKKEPSRKSRERVNSASSTNSREDGLRKRSPDRDNERTNKRRRGSESGRGSKTPKQPERQPDKEKDTCNESSSDKSRGSSISCSCGGKRGEENKDLLVSTFYDEEPRVQDGPDHYLAEAKRLKHQADSFTDKESKVHTYVEAILNFVRCGKSLEQDKDTETRSAYQMYSETLVLMRYVMRTFLNRGSRLEASKDKRLAGLCMRLQALIYLHMYKLKKDQVMSFSKTLTESFCKAPPKGVQAPSPYNPSSNKMTETPSPMSPTPSPSGSVGSTSSNEAVATPSRNGKLPSGSVTSPVNISVAQKTYTMTSQHLSFTNTLLYSHDCWDSSRDIVLSNKEFFMDLDRRLGPLTLHSSMVHAVNYVEQGLKLLKTSV